MIRVLCVIGVLSLGILFASITAKLLPHLCTQYALETLESPDARYIVLASYRSCGGATSAYGTSVYLARKDATFTDPGQVLIFDIKAPLTHLHIAWQSPSLIRIEYLIGEPKKWTRVLHAVVFTGEIEVEYCRREQAQLLGSQAPCFPILEGADSR